MYFGVMLYGYITSVFNKRLFFYAFGIILAIMAFCRYGIGLDFFAYEYLFNRLQTSIIDEIRYGVDSQEPGFRVIGAFLKGIGLSYQQYLIFFAAIDIFFVMKICKRYSKNPTLSLVVFFSFYMLTWTFSGIRQSVVMAVGIYYLLRCIERNATFKLIVISVLLSFIHSTGLILIVLYFIAKINFKKSKLIMLTVISVIISLLPMGFLLNKLPWLPFMDRVYPYLDISLSINLFDFQGLARILFIIIIFLYYDVLASKSDINRKMANMYIMSVVLYFCFQFSELTAARIAIYGKYLDAILLVNILYAYKLKINKLLYSYLLLALCSLYLYKESSTFASVTIMDNQFSSKIAPYVHVLNKEHAFFRRKSLFENDL